MPGRGIGSDGDLVALARQLGYEFVTDAAALSANLDRRRGEPAGPLLGLFAAQEFFVQTAEGFGAIYDPPVALADLTSAAIKILAQNPNGFFLMVEESAIDRMAHRNNAPLTLKGVLELDRAVQVALAFASRVPDTLIIVTADHECGGLAVAGSEDQPYPYEPGVDYWTRCSRARMVRSRWQTRTTALSLAGRQPVTQRHRCRSRQLGLVASA